MSDIEARVHERYARWAPRSAALAERARRSFPGGDTRMSAHFAPHPLFMERGEGGSRGRKSSHWGPAGPLHLTCS